MEKNHPKSSTSALQIARTLEKEKDALDRLISSFSIQLEAVREQKIDVLEEATLKTSREVQQLTLLKHERRKQVAAIIEETGMEPPSTFSTFLEEWNGYQTDEQTKHQILEVYQAIKQMVGDAQSKGSELAYTLQYALHLGQEILQSIQGINAPPAIQLYDKQGNTSLSHPARSFVNKIG